MVCRRRYQQFTERTMKLSMTILNVDTYCSVMMSKTLITYKKTVFIFFMIVADNFDEVVCFSTTATSDLFFRLHSIK